MPEWVKYCALFNLHTAFENLKMQESDTPEYGILISPNPSKVKRGIDWSNYSRNNRSVGFREGWMKCNIA